MQQLLPFKLSEDGKSPGSRQQQQQRYAQHQQYYNLQSSHSQKHLSGLPGGSLRYSSSSTLPKTGGSNVTKVTNYGNSGGERGGGSSSGANSDDDRVIYF